MKTTTSLPSNLSAATERLAQAILHSEYVSTYQQAKDSLHADPQAVALLERLSSTQADLRIKQNQGALTQAEINALRALQKEVQANPKIMAYAQTQQDAIRYLPYVNDEISELIGIDFASLAGPASC